jgi:hypothetical protein
MLNKFKKEYSGLCESPKLILNKWVEPYKISDILSDLHKKISVFGDIYARFVG